THRGGPRGAASPEPVFAGRPDPPPTPPRPVPAVPAASRVRLPATRRRVLCDDRHLGAERPRRRGVRPPDDRDGGRRWRAGKQLPQPEGAGPHEGPVHVRQAGRHPTGCRRAAAGAEGSYWRAGGMSPRCRADTALAGGGEQIPRPARAGFANNSPGVLHVPPAVRDLPRAPGLVPPALRGTGAPQDPVRPARPTGPPLRPVRTGVPVLA